MPFAPMLGQCPRGNRNVWHMPADRQSTGDCLCPLRIKPHAVNVRLSGQGWFCASKLRKRFSFCLTHYSLLRTSNVSHSFYSCLLCLLIRSAISRKAKVKSTLIVINMEKRDNLSINLAWLTHATPLTDITFITWTPLSVGLSCILPPAHGTDLWLDSLKAPPAPSFHTTLLYWMQVSCPVDWVADDQRHSILCPAFTDSSNPVLISPEQFTPHRLPLGEPCEKFECIILHPEHLSSISLLLGTKYLHSSHHNSWRLWLAGKGKDGLSCISVILSAPFPLDW